VAIVLALLTRRPPPSAPLPPAPIAASQPAVIAEAQPLPPPHFAYGALTVNSNPWARVIIDGKPVAKETPLRNFRLPAGAHEVELVRPDGKRAAFSVQIRDGETAVKMFEF
jgi:hypothetical protein